MRTAPTILVLLSALAAVLPGAAEATPGWTQPITLPFDVIVSATPSFGFADGGMELAARVEATQPVDPTDVVTRLVVSRKLPGGPWTEEVSLPSMVTAVPFLAALAVAPNGAAVLAFAEAVASDFTSSPQVRWRAAYRSPDGAWEAPATLFVDPYGTPPDITTNLLCAIAPDGTAVAGAQHAEPDDFPFEPAPGQHDARLDLSLRPAGGGWEPAQRLSAPDASVEYDPALAVDAGGNFTVAWTSRFSEGATSSTSDDEHTLLVRRRLAGQSLWNTAEDLTGSDVTKDVFFRGFMGVGGDGRAVIAFQYAPSGAVWAASRLDSLHPFATPVQVATTGSSSVPSGVGVAPDGRAYLLYLNNGTGSGTDYVGMAMLPPAGAWSAEMPVSPIGISGYSGGIRFDGNDAIAVWAASDATTHLVQATRWVAGDPAPEVYRDLESLPADAVVERVDADGTGGVAAVWYTGDALREAAWDASGPSLVSSSVPSSAIAGEVASFAASFADLWSAVPGEPSWDFGDGTPVASGSTVPHGFAAAGTYAVTVSAVDALGNPGAATFMVAVSECESLAAADGLACRCRNGVALPACGGATLPTALGSRFAAACKAVAGAEAAGSGRRARRSAARAVKGFKQAAGTLRTKPGRRLPAGCRDALASVLGTARDHAAELKRTF